jgi:hypothetical protein
MIVALRCGAIEHKASDPTRGRSREPTAVWLVGAVAVVSRAPRTETREHEVTKCSTAITDSHAVSLFLGSDVEFS